MSFSGTIKLDRRGLNNVIDALEKLPKELRRSAERAVLREGAKPIKKAVVAKVPVDTGNLKKSIGVSVSAGRRNGYGSARVGPRSGAKFRHKKNKSGRKGKSDKAIGAEEYGWYLETGTPRMAARPFIRPAIDQSQGEVLSAMSSGLDSHLSKVAARLRNRTGGAL